MHSRQDPGWPVTEFARNLRDHFVQRYHRQGIRFPSLIETVVTLALAELYRNEGNEDSACVLISELSRTYPRTNAS